MSAQVPNDEDYEEDQEPDSPAIQVDLAMLRKTLTSHVDAKLRIEADIPAEAITAGACELNAFALRTELGDKHMAIVNKVLETHSEHILEFSDFLDSRYKSMMRELCKQPEDIEGAANGVLLRFHAIFMNASPSEIVEGGLFFEFEAVSRAGTRRRKKCG